MGIYKLIFLLFLNALSLLMCCSRDKFHILVITGGHDFERASFFKMMDGYTDVRYQEMSHPQANAQLGSQAVKTCDAMVFYDMNQDISAEQKALFMDLLKQGKGMVFLHHSLASYQQWDEFAKIRGGRYHLEPGRFAGMDLPASTYRHDVDIAVKITDPSHPVTKGLVDFTIHDEVYGQFSVLPGVTPLLTTDHPESSPVIAWTHRYENSRIIYIQLGHDHVAYENAAFKKLAHQAVLWACANP